jgi:hypothetical protein
MQAIELISHLNISDLIAGVRMLIRAVGENMHAINLAQTDCSKS